ncbi:Fungal-trans domain-containing protein [Mycena chlorophos]|uniref:Fungal-trans domain-containing protein n=1 Tax=Mycena chlorophos TaxID=658473 RepID=A0A8H6SV47_MYCCL|nr:Fungal-trans domain-containing protein [Mycena chlorophos]
MSSTLQPKLRRLRGACDICRRQKKRCDSANMPGNKCSSCIAFNSDCTHNFGKNNKEEKKRRTRVEGTTNFIDTTRALVDGILNASYHFPEERSRLIHVLHDLARYARHLERAPAEPVENQRPATRRSASLSSVQPEDEEVDELEEDDSEPGLIVDLKRLPEHLQRLTISTADKRYFGKNGSVLFNQRALETRLTNGKPQQRPEFWEFPPWQTRPEVPLIVQRFPPPDLLKALVDIYFTQINIFCFLLHRPTFESSLADGLHLRDHRFGSIVLAVCALACKNSPDPRVLLPGVSDEHSAGWEWFSQIRRPFSGPVLQSASLYELQLCCLYVLFQQSGTDIESCWLLCGIGILHAQDVGADRGVVSADMGVVEAELMKRACLWLYKFDAIVGACFGRQRVGSTSTNQAGLDPPVLCDDEYWPPAQRLAVTANPVASQPPGIPPKAAFWERYTTLVSLFASPPQTSCSQLAFLDARLDEWTRTIPQHLVWDPHKADDAFFDQSAVLHALYYHVQIMVHRPFLRPKARLISKARAMRSLSICVNAARSCAHIAEVKCRRGYMPNGTFMKAVLDSSVVLLLTIKGGADGGLSLDMHRELEGVYKCLHFLRLCERRWQNAGRFGDIIRQFIVSSGLPLPPPSPPPVDCWVGPMLPHTPSSAGLAPPFIGTGDDTLADLDALQLPLGSHFLGDMPIFSSAVVEASSLSLGDDNMASIGYMLADSEGPVNEPWSNALSASPPASEMFLHNGPGGIMNISDYITHWSPYFSAVGEVTQGRRV